MEAIINRFRYSTETADLVASDRYWDGSNYDRSGRNTYLYKTHKGNFFAYYSTKWQGEFNSIRPLSFDDAIELFESLSEHEMTYEEAFNVSPTEA